MAKVTIKLNRAGVEQLLKSSEIKADIDRRAAAIALAAGASGGVYGHDVQIGQHRVHGLVWTDDIVAIRAEATRRALTKAIDAGRG